MTLTDKNKKKTEESKKKGIKNLYAMHPGIIKFALFSTVLLLLLLMVAIQTGDVGRNSSKTMVANMDTKNDAEEKADEKALDNNEDYEQDSSDGNEADSSEELSSLADEDKAALEEKNPAIKKDAFDLIGMNLLDAEDEIGKGIAKGSPDICYFMSAGAYITYNLETELISSVEMDGDGDGRVDLSMLGVEIGDDLEMAKESLSLQGIDIIDLQENTFMCNFYLGNDNTSVYEIYVESENGKVTNMKISIT